MFSSPQQHHLPLPIVGFSTTDLPPEGEGKNNKPRKRPKRSRSEKREEKNRSMKKERKLKQTFCSIFGCFMIKSQRIKKNLMF
jgi:hypothetical protein